MHQKDLLALSAHGMDLIHQSRVPPPGLRVSRIKVQVPINQVRGFRPITFGFGSLGSPQQGRRIAPNLIVMGEVDHSDQEGDRGDDRSQKYQVDLPHQWQRLQRFPSQVNLTLQESVFCVIRDDNRSFGSRIPQKNPG